jgi:hypothetical protein
MARVFCTLECTYSHAVLRTSSGATFHRESGPGAERRVREYAKRHKVRIVQSHGHRTNAEDNWR